MANTTDSTQISAQLKCRICGNGEHFIQVMEHVENLVDANYNHLHLLIGIPGNYYCKDCGEPVDQRPVL